MMSNFIRYLSDILLRLPVETFDNALAACTGLEPDTQLIQVGKLRYFRGEKFLQNSRVLGRGPYRVDAIKGYKALTYVSHVCHG